MTNRNFKVLVCFSIAAALLASCQKEEILTEPQIDAPESEAVAGKLISATKTSSVPATDYLEKFIGSEQSEDKTVELLKLQLLGMDLVHFDIVTYRIHYWSTTIVNGEPKYIKLAGDVSYIADSTGFIKTRHLESISMFHTMFNTTAVDTELYEYYYLNLRSIYNALVIYPFYQGGPDTELPGAEGSEGKNVLTSEFIIKAKQAIDCELAALEFIDQQEGVEMMPGYYTENIGISNGGGPALAFQYVLENDAAYKGFGDQINLRSTYVGAGNCSNESLVENMYKVDESTFMGGVAPVGYITTVAGAYATWRGKYFKDDENPGEYLDLKYYFTEDLLQMEYSWKDSIWVNSGSYNEDNPLNVYLDNNPESQMSLLYYHNGMTLSNTVSRNVMDEDKKLVENDFTDALLEAFAENDKITSGWNPEAEIRIVHSLSDEFLAYKTNYRIWKNLSHYGFNHHVKLETQTDMSHVESTKQCVVNVLLNRHPFSGEIRIPAEYVLDFLWGELL